MGITANVVDGKLDYTYTNSAEKKNELKGSKLGYDQFLQLLCAEMQYQDPLEPTSNTDYVAQMATFSQLEATLSMQGTQQNAMASSLVGQQVILKVENDSGKTTYVEGKVDYAMYENGEVFLSVDNGLYPLSSLDTVADSSYYEAMTTAKTLSSMISALPDFSELTTAYKTAVQQIRDLYDGMTEYQKKFVSEDDLKKLKAYEARIEELVKAAESSESEEQIVENADGETEETKDETETKDEPA